MYLVISAICGQGLGHVYIQPRSCFPVIDLRLAAAAFLIAAALPATAAAQLARTPNLCDSMATDISSRYAVQLMSGTPQRSDRSPDPLVGRFTTAVQLYDALECPMRPLAAMLECLQVASIEVGGDVRKVLARRQKCEAQYRSTITGR
jgi:hypothetical protein